MSAAVASAPCVLHALPGRLRVHLAGWNGAGKEAVETSVLSVPGVTRVEASAVTHNVLVLFDPAAATPSEVLAAVQAVPVGGTPARDHARPGGVASTETYGTPHTLGQPPSRARLAVRGLRRNPAVAREVVARLERLPGVRAVASTLTGRVLIEYGAHQTELEELLAAIARVEPPGLPDEDLPAHPLDPMPLVQSATRAIATALGLGLLATRQSAGAQAPLPGASGAAVTAGVVSLARSFPATRSGLRRLLGRDVADLTLTGVGIAALTLSGSPLGLALAGAEALRLLTEVMARREAWRAYEARLGESPVAIPGAVIRLEAGQRAPLAATVLEGTGITVDRDGLPVPALPGRMVSAGARVYGGPLTVELRGESIVLPEPRSVPPVASLADRYHAMITPLAVAYAAVTAIVTRSPARAFAALLLVNPRTALIGTEAAAHGAAARVLRTGVIVAGTRPGRGVRLPNVLVVDGPRVFTDGVELTSVVPLVAEHDAAAAQGLAAGIAAAAGSPWGSAFPSSTHLPATEGAFDGATATASVSGIAYTLGPLATDDAMSRGERLRHRGAVILVLRRRDDERPLAFVILRPRLAAGVEALVQTCRSHGVELALVGSGYHVVARAIAHRAQTPLIEADDATAVVRSRQATGAIVAVLSDSAQSAAAFAASDLAIALTSGRSGRFAAAADLLAPDLGAVAAVVDAGARREIACRDSVVLSAAANVVGATWGILGGAGVVQALRVVEGSALAAIAAGWIRLRGGARPRSSLIRLADPRPERWGMRSAADVVQAMRTTAHGLTTTDAELRFRDASPPPARHGLRNAILGQLGSPLHGILGAGAGLSLALGAPLDAAIIGATIAVGVGIGVWQEQRAGDVAASLERLGAATARVLRDGALVTLPASAVVPGDVLVLAPGDRVAADARLLEARNLEVDEAALTGESLPTSKAPDGGTDASRVVLAGSDVTVGTGRAVVFATGHRTRIGATAAALAFEETTQSPLGLRLSQMLQQVLPIAAVGGLLVGGAGVLRGQPLLAQLTLGATVAIAAVPEGLPLLVGVGQAAVARRLAHRRAFVRRLGAVEALGRVDVACTDKTGTLTEGRLALTVIAHHDWQALLGQPANGALPLWARQLLRTAALASPHPDAPDATADSTDVAVLRRAREAGLYDDLRRAREAEAPFDPVRGFHATLVDGHVHVKGAMEVLLSRCDRVRRGAVDYPLDEAGRRALAARAERLAGRGLRVLMVARGGLDTPVDDPRGLVALGYLGFSDPLRPDVPAAVARCRAAGIHVVMLTGDHPATARVIAQEAGLLDSGGAVLTGDDIAELDNGDLDRRLEGATVLARVTPLDKLRIVESLQRRGHVVAMTGDGVNDAPALRLADVGVAMGRGGTDVARQAADVVLADDDFATLVEAMVEGRSFWRNIRRSLGLLLGGNLGELGLLVGASVLGRASPLVTRQILVVNLITDALPALAVVVQRPVDRDLAGLAREGTSALDAPLRNDILRRGVLTAGPSLAAYLLALPLGGLPQARAVAFASVVATQLAQTLQAGRVESGLTTPVLGAVAGSGALLVTILTVPPLRSLLALGALTPLGWGLVGGSTIATLLLCQTLAPHSNRSSGYVRPARAQPTRGTPSTAILG